MGLSFQEKSLWVTFIGIVASFGFYFATVIPTSTAQLMPQQVALFIAATVFLVITQVVGHMAIAVLDRDTATDERDRHTELRGTRNGAYVLASGVFFTLCTALVTPGNFAVTHVLLGSWVLAQLVTIGSQLFIYRREA